MRTLAYAAVLAGWVAWFWPFIFHAQHGRKVRKLATLTGATVAGIALEAAAFLVAFLFHEAAGTLRLALAVALLPVPIWLAWTAVPHLGKQFRIRAGLFADHELVRTGPYAIVRHPIYASLLLMLLSNLLLLTRWPWWLVALSVFIAGTEIRVRTEDVLLRSAFGEDFERYRASVPAYLPFLR
jgi:protein-S-isoprenylcysteine O-methyltransferase Ste14